MISPMTTDRPQKRYDHRLRELVQRTGDLTIATDVGVPRSTARGWLRTAPTVVVSSGRRGPDRAGTPPRDPQTATIHPETRGAAPARAGPAAPPASRWPASDSPM